MSGGLQFERELAGAEGAKCATCGSELVAKMDALARIRYRCRKCDGISPTRPRHPDETMHAQALVPASRAVTALPPVMPGQLRCQRCAKGVDGIGRFCSAACLKAVRDAKKRKPCRTCHEMYLPSLQTPVHCADCMAKAKAPKTRVCTGCNRIQRQDRGRLVVASCKACRAERRVGRVCQWKPKVCSCGVTFDPPGPASKWCPACRPAKREAWKATRNSVRRRQSA